jgi:hypothetical protein
VGVERQKRLINVCAVARKDSWLCVVVVVDVMMIDERPRYLPSAAVGKIT